MQDMLRNPGKYKKFWAALAAPLSVLVYVMAPIDSQAAFHVTANEWYLVLLAGSSAVGVRQFANKE